MVDRRILLTLSECRDRMANSLAEPSSWSRFAGEANYSPFHLHRLFRSVYGETPLEFIARRRLDSSRQMLRETELPIWMIAIEVGYASDTTFASWFRSHVGCTPSQYRESARMSYQLGRLWSRKFIPGCFYSPANGPIKL